MNTSSLSQIINIPASPMQLFAQCYNEPKLFSDPNTFSNAMGIASRTENDEILNRNVLLRQHDDNGWVFVTERNSVKYKGFKKYPSVAVTFLWVYVMNNTIITRQVRAIGKVMELNETQIAEFYEEEPLFAKIRDKICRCGEPVDWNELKIAHDKVFNDFQKGKESLLRTNEYTAMRIAPEKVDFYYAEKNTILKTEIGPIIILLLRLKYTINNYQ